MSCDKLIVNKYKNNNFNQRILSINYNVKKNLSIEIFEMLGLV